LLQHDMHVKKKRGRFVEISPVIEGLSVLAFALLALAPGGVEASPSDQQSSPRSIAASTSPASSPVSSASPVEVDAEHAKLFTDNKYPSAGICRRCHPEQYREWSVSAHAYAELSPVFNAMQATITKLTDGSNGDFCERCHTQVGTPCAIPPPGARLATWAF
jgi:hypothetical protein